MTKNRLSLFCLFFFFLICSCKEQSEKPNEQSQWSEYLGGPDRNHYSSLTQINVSNVGQLKKVWEYKSGDSGQVQCNPIIVDGVLFGVTASNQVFALNAATGQQKWRYIQPGVRTSNINRGVTYWQAGSDKRILYAYNSELYALNAETGALIKSFGDSGKVSLRLGLEPNSKDKFVISTTPGTLFEDLIVMPLRVGEDAGAAIGYIQAFNVKTGKLVWVFKTIPDKGMPGADTWPSTTKEAGQVGAANNWSGMAIDRKREIIYVPTGSAAPDFYGGNRLGQNLYANCLIALNARTGKYIWHYQMVHHDIWDKDLPAPPNLITVVQDGKTIDAVAQITKQGLVFLFDRETGTPLFPIDEKPFPASTLPGEQTWPTQPIPQLPAPFARQTVTEAEISTIAENRKELLETFRNSQKGLYQPLNLTPTVVLPGADGGAEWGGAAADPDGILYVNANEMPWLFSLSPTQGLATTSKNLTPGGLLYINNCITCHGPELKGNSASGFPSLVNIKAKLSRKEMSGLLTNGRGMMPGFSNISELQKQNIIDFLYREEKVEATSMIASYKNKNVEVKYKFNGYDKFLDNNGYPAITPPWGTLTAIDMNTGKHLWQKTLGEFKELTAKGIAQTGTENYGGPAVTAGGLLFIAATKDGMFRAYNKKTGELLFETELPAAGFATPSTYKVNGKQYIVIACGGNKLGTKSGDSYVAFALN
ncbi:pyrroloquinoline quinone-dependent dehydrogenase [Pedobacter sp. JCM 36344]|uniref:pyrroloquinoline quinone-dependent dehydrogenase n=1 Tax=Pedobacter sp. JCM 36344 TaxID=3374280 RepID=UPI0039786ECB